MYCSHKHFVGVAPVPAGPTLWMKVAPLAAAGMDVVLPGAALGLVHVPSETAVGYCRC